MHSLSRYIFFFLICLHSLEAQEPDLSFSINPNGIVHKKPSRIGLNLGGLSRWDAANLATNVLNNGSFEGTIDRVLITVERVEGSSFLGAKGQGYPDGYWNGAIVDVRSGPSAGQKGIISDSLESGIDGYPEFVFVDSSTGGINPPPFLEKGDVVVLTKEFPPESAEQIWISGGSEGKISYSQDVPPESQGKYSLEMKPQSFSDIAEFKYYFDAGTENQPKFLQIDGKWTLSFFAKASNSGSSVEISLRRISGGPDLLLRTFNLTSGWKKYLYEFDASDTGPNSLLEFKVTARGDRSSIWIDDMSLKKSEEANQPFRQILVDALKTIQPSFLRNTFESNTLANMLSTDLGRKGVFGRVWMYPSKAFGYSLPDFLNLCAQVGANPWIILPSILSDKEYDELGKFLALQAPKSRFPDVIIEFGNENWNYMFLSMALPNPKQLGPVADRAFNLIKQGNQSKSGLINVIGGQYDTEVSTSIQSLDNTTQADRFTLAPYFLNSLDANITPSQGVAQAFQESVNHLKEFSDALKSRGKQLTIYEVNFHTMKGKATGALRNQVVAGRASGAILAKKILQYMALNIDPILIFNLAQSQAGLWEVNDQVSLWGIFRNFGPPPLVRPTGLAVTMLNRIIAGDMLAITPLSTKGVPNTKITAYSFKAPNEWTAVLVSENDQPLTVELYFPEDGLPMPSQQATLTSNSPFDTNETSEKVKIQEGDLNVNGRVATVTIPAYGLVTLGKASAQARPATEPEIPPAEPETPTTPEVPPAVPETPTTPEAPPAEPETPTTPEVPPAEPETPTTPEAPPAEPEIPTTPEVPPAVPETPTTPEAPPAEPETPTNPEVPPAEPEIPTTPEVPPAEPETPTTPEVPPAEPETPTTPEVPPAEPETPTTPEVPPAEPETPTTPGLPPAEPETPTVPKPEPKYPKWYNRDSRQHESPKPKQEPRYPRGYNRDRNQYENPKPKPIENRKNEIQTQMQELQNKRNELRQEYLKKREEYQDRLKTIREKRQELRSEIQRLETLN